MTFKTFLAKENTITEGFTQIASQKLIDTYIKKVKPDEVLSKGVQRFDIEDGFYIKFSAVSDDKSGKRELIGYRIDVDARSFRLGQSDVIFLSWDTIVSKYYNIETEKIGDSFSKIFQ